MAVGVLAAGGALVACSDDGTDAPDEPPGSLADDETIDQPPSQGGTDTGTGDDGVNDVSDGSGEGGNRSGGEPVPGTGSP